MPKRTPDKTRPKERLRQDDVLIRSGEVARMFNLHRNTVQRAVRAGTFPVKPVKVSRTNYWIKREVEDFLDGHARAS